MLYVDIVIALAVLQAIVFAFKVGGARQRYGIKAPAITGNEIFERHFRVQQNTLELMVAFLPAIYLFSRHVSPVWAAALGAIYLVGREIFAYSYVRDPAKRGFGFMTSFLPVAVLLAGGLAMSIWGLIH